MLSRDQLCAYIGVCESTLIRICPVRPRDLGANVVRYDRRQIDAWVEGLPPRLMTPRTAALPSETQPSQDEAAPDPAQDQEDRAAAALERARARASGGRSQWRRTG